MYIINFFYYLMKLVINKKKLKDFINKKIKNNKIFI